MKIKQNQKLAEQTIIKYVALINRDIISKISYLKILHTFLKINIKISFIC